MRRCHEIGFIDRVSRANQLWDRLCLLFASCAWIPKGDPPAQYLDPPEMTETLAEVTSRLQNWPEDHWWEQFGNPGVERADRNRAQKDNPGLKHAAARLRQATSLVKVEGARLLPFLEADASLTYERISQHGVFAALNPEVAGIKIMYGIINPLSFRYEFDFWGKTGPCSRRLWATRLPKRPKRPRCGFD